MRVLQQTTKNGEIPKVNENPNHLVVPTNETRTIDVASQQLQFDEVTLEGALVLSTSDPEISEAVISVRVLRGAGSITCELPKLIIRTGEVAAPGAVFTANERIEVQSDLDLKVRGGTFDAPAVHFECTGRLNVYADRVNGEASLSADTVSFGVASGNLNIPSTKITGDPCYYNRAGDITLGGQSTAGQDLYVFATGNVTISGAIDTTGGTLDDEHPGRVYLSAGCDSITPDFDPNPPSDDQVGLDCGNCDIVLGELDVIEGDDPGGDLTVSGGINASSLSAFGANVSIDGDLNLIGLDLPDESVQPGGGGITFSQSATVTGTITCQGYDGGVGPWSCEGLFGTSYNQTINIGDVYGDCALNAYNNGSITVGNVEAYRNIEIFAGVDSDDLPTCGGGPSIVKRSFGKTAKKDCGCKNCKQNKACGCKKQSRAAAIEPRTTGATLQAGNLYAKGFIQVYASGDAVVGDVELDTNDLGGYWDSNPHALTIYANLGGDASADPFNVGGGGTNGCGTLTNNGYPRYSTAAIAVGNPGGITVSSADVVVNSGNNGTPWIVLDAGQGTLTLDAGLAVNGSDSVGAGQIILIGAKLVIPSGSTLSASDAYTGLYSNPLVAIGISSIPLTGNLTIQCNSVEESAVVIGPSDYLAVDWSSQLFTLCYNDDTTNGVDISGSGNVSITANSTSGMVDIYGTPVTFEAGTVTVTSQGQNSNITINYNEGVSGVPTFVSTGGTVTLNADGPAYNAGNISITADSLNITSGLNAHASALDTGAGGTISIDTNTGNISIVGGTGGITLAANGSGEHGSGGAIYLDSVGTLTVNSNAVSVLPGTDGNGGDLGFSADGAVTVSGVFNVSGDGTGNGGSIGVEGNTLDISSASFTADGGDSGSGGEVYLYTTTGDLTIAASDVSASAGTGGNGGIIYLQIGGNLTATGDFDVSGDAAGSGGTLYFSGNTLNISDATFTADGGDAASAGQIELTSQSNLSVDSSQISLLAGTNGNGGSLTIGAGGVCTLSDNFDASAGEGTGTGGNFNIYGDSLSVNSVTFYAEGGTTGTGSGGNIQLSSTDPTTDLTLNSVQMFATGINGGEITINAGANIDVDDESTISASGSARNGGSVTLNASQGNNSDITIAADIYTSVGGFGFTPGQITLNYSQPAGSSNTQIQSGALVDAGTRGTITINNVQDGGLNITITEATLSASSGTLQFMQTSGDVTVSGTNSETDGPLIGYVEAAGSSIYITTSGPDQLTVASALAGYSGGDGDVQLQTNQALNIVASELSTPSVSGTGDVILQGDGVAIAVGTGSGEDYVEGSNITVLTSLSSDGDIQLGANLVSDGLITVSAHGSGGINVNGGQITSQTDGANNSLLISTESGNVADLPDASPLHTSVASLTFASTAGSIMIVNSTDYDGGLVINTSTAGAGISIESNGAVSASSIQSTSAGDIRLVADTNALTVTASSVISTADGSIYLQNRDTESGSIVLQLGVQILATLDEEETDDGVFIYLGTTDSPPLIEGTNPGNVLVSIEDGGAVYWGDPTISTPGDSANTIEATAATVAFNAAGDEENITLDGDARINADNG